MSTPKALVIGSSGLIGGLLTQRLLADDRFGSVLLLNRKSIGQQHPKLEEVLVSDFTTLDASPTPLIADIVFCCIGTTRSKTPDLTTYRQIDHDIPVLVGKLAFAQGASQYHFVSSLGADPNSKNYYTRIKGETERDIAAIPFESVHFYRPSLLLGDRKENRIGERVFKGLMTFINPLLSGSLAKYRSISAYKVAQAMAEIALRNQKGIHIHSSEQLQQFS